MLLCNKEIDGVKFMARAHTRSDDNVSFFVFLFYRTPGVKEESEQMEAADITVGRRCQSSTSSWRL